MGDGYWEGALYLFHSKVETDGSNSGNISWDISPGTGNEFEVLYGFIDNGDALAARIARVRILSDSDDTILQIMSESLGAQVRKEWPNKDNEFEPGLGRLFVGGNMSLFGIVQAVGVNQVATFACALRIRGRKPSPTISGPTGSTETRIKEKFY